MATTEIEKIPHPVNKPSSGTYGEGAALDRLNQSLPPMGQGAQGEGVQVPPMPEPPQPSLNPPGRPASAPPGVPGSLLHPSSQPGVPLNTPLDRGQQTAVPMERSAQEARGMLLQQLSESPQVSEATRKWARHVLDMLEG